ncbi:MAG: DUF4340 domain-containing protein [Verrucomicrobia bacterium]|jgi:hypothetical protein|nr:DUF4340 domain-containing protein [Verrucomicrobiota bacterium]
MNLKKLVVVIAVLAVLAGLTLFLERTPEAGPLDERAGEEIIADQQLRDLSRLVIREDGEPAVTLARGDHGHWFLAGEFRRPVDFSRLSRLADTLAEAEIRRFVTERPERLQRLNLGQKGLVLYTPASDEPVLEILLGDTGGQGGTYFQFAGDDRAYLLSERLWLDTGANNWADKSPFDRDISAIASLELAFAPAEEPTLVVTREDAEADFAQQTENDDREVAQERVTRFLRSLLNLRSTRIAPLDGEEAVAARDHRRPVRLRTFDGNELHLSIGRKPEVPAPVEATAPAEGDGEEGGESDPGPLEEAGPVLVWLEKLPPKHPFTDLAGSHALVVGDSLFTNFPAEDEILKPKEPTEEGEVQP